MNPNRPLTCPNSAVVSKTSVKYAKIPRNIRQIPRNLSQNSAVVPQVLIYFRFVLVPLTLAYFFTFLLSPVQNLFEYRCGTQPKAATDHHIDDRDRSMNVTSIRYPLDPSPTALGTQLDRCGPATLCSRTVTCSPGTKHRRWMSLLWCAVRSSCPTRCGTPRARSAWCNPIIIRHDPSIQRCH